MHIQIDLEVYKALTNQLVSENESLNDVLRRVLSLPAIDTGFQPGEIDTPSLPVPSQNALAPHSGGAWFSNVFLPNFTRFRATYKGRTYRGMIQNSQWIDEFGNVRTSPSDAATAITGNNVNGWRFWFVLPPGEEDWQRMDTLKS